MSAPRTNTAIRSAVPARRSGKRAKRPRTAALKLARTIAIAFGVLSILLPIAMMVAWSRAKAEPAWWAEASTLGDPNAPNTARLLEQGVTTALHTVRPDGEPWFVRVSDDELNAWLQHRLGLWLENRGADVTQRISPPRVLISESRLTLGIAGPDGQPSGVFAATVTLAIDENASLVATDRSFRVGRLPLPDRFISQVMFQGAGARGTAADPIAETLFLPDASVPAQITLSDGRRVRLLGADLNADGTMTLELVTDLAP